MASFWVRCEMISRFLKCCDEVVVCEIHEELLKPDTVIHKLMLMLLVPAAVEVLHKWYVVLCLSNLNWALVKNVYFLKYFFQ